MMKCIGISKTGWLQEIRNSGASGYKYITVDEDDAASVIYANNTLVHLSAEQIPKGSAVCHVCFVTTFTFCLSVNCNI